jgi:hypothetical protein
MGCVAIRHLFHISDLDAGILSSHPGLAIFAGLSGYLALGSTDTPFHWLSKRLQRIYPSYWICLAAIFAANTVVHYKPMSPSLILCQFLGIAHFTHPGSLVGVHTWFITLIVTCYILAAFIRWERRLLPVAVLLVLALDHWHGDFMWGFVMAFVGGAIVGALPKVRTGALGVAAASFAAAIAFGPLFLNPLWGSLALLLGSFFVGKPPRVLKFASRCTYEFYLTHGPIYLGLSRIIELSFYPNLIIGTPLAILCALALQRAARGARAATSRIVQMVRVPPTIDEGNTGRTVQPESQHGSPVAAALTIGPAHPCGVHRRGLAGTALSARRQLG